MLAALTTIFTHAPIKQDTQIENDAEQPDNDDVEPCSPPRRSANKKTPKLPYDRVHVRHRGLPVETTRVDKKAKKATEKAVKKFRAKKSATS